MIEVRALSRYYGDFAALTKLDFDIKKNEVVGFVGRNGAGKSTALKILAGLLAPSTGTVVIDGTNIESANSKFRSKIGFLPEKPPLYDEMTVTEFLKYLGKLRGLSSTEINNRVPKVITKCQLKGKEKAIINELSLGFQKRVGIAQAIVHNPQLVILDEPISGLDPFQIVEMRKVIRSLASESTVLLSSHNLNEIEETCDRILILQAGKINYQGTTEQLLQQEDIQQKIQERIHLIEALLILNGKDLHTVIEKIPAIQSHKITHQKEDIVSIEFQMQGIQVEEITAALIQQGCGVRSIQNNTAELEQIFLDLTSREEK